MEIGYALMNANLYGPKRTPKYRMDFGDNATVGKHLRKMSIWENAGPDDQAWGVYLGEIDGLWVVGTMTILELGPTGTEEYQTLDQLKLEWELD